MHPVVWLPRQEASSNKVEDSVWLDFFAGEVPGGWMAGLSHESFKTQNGCKMKISGKKWHQQNVYAPFFTQKTCLHVSKCSITAQNVSWTSFASQVASI